MPFSSFIDDQQIDEGYIDISEFSGDDEMNDSCATYCDSNYPSDSD